jgi:hypothetical protein
MTCRGAVARDGGIYGAVIELLSRTTSCFPSLTFLPSNNTVSVNPTGHYEYLARFLRGCDRCRCLRYGKRYNSPLFSLTRCQSLGAAAASALAAEKCFSRIRVFERREAPGGTWIYDSDPGRPLQPSPGHLPPDLDLPIDIPPHLPATAPPVRKERFDQTPIYSELTYGANRRKVTQSTGELTVHAAGRMYPPLLWRSLIIHFFHTGLLFHTYVDLSMLIMPLNDPNRRSGFQHNTFKHTSHSKEQTAYFRSTLQSRM